MALNKDWELPGMYRVGYPFWKTVARRGVPLTLRVDVFHDRESNTFWAKSPNLDGLVVSGETLDELRSEVRTAAEVLLDLSLHGHGAVKPEFRFGDEVLCSA